MQESDTKRRHKILEHLQSNKVGVLASVTEHENPYATVIYFSVNDDFEATFVTKESTKKRANIEHNDHVMLVAYDVVKQTTIQLSGIASEITDPEASHKAFAATVDASWRTSEAGVPPISKLAAGPYIAFKITPVQIRLAAFKDTSPDNFDYFETIDFPVQAK